LQLDAALCQSWGAGGGINLPHLGLLVHESMGYKKSILPFLLRQLAYDVGSYFLRR